VAAIARSHLATDMPIAAQRDGSDAAFVQKLLSSISAANISSMRAFISCF
jgi:hypothetical protein